MKIHILRTLSIIVALACLQEANCQKIGFKGGLNFSDIALELSEDLSLDGPKTKIKLGYHFGFVVDLKLSEDISLQPGLMFSSKGYSVDDLQTDDYDRSSINYLEIPFNVRLNVFEEL